jgi:hypothetical protein
LNAWVGKTQAGGALAAGCHRSVDGLQSIFAEDTIVAQPLDLDQPLIGRKSALVYPDPPIGAEEINLFAAAAPGVRLLSATEWLAGAQS